MRHAWLRYAHRILVGKPERKRSFGRPWGRWRLIFEWVLEKLWSGFIWLRIGASGGLMCTR